MKQTFKGLQLIIPIVAVFLGAACSAQEKREDWINKSAVIIKGDVLLLQTSTIDWNDPSDMGVVRLQEIIAGGQQLNDFLKQPITVKFRSIKNIKKGQSIIVYGNLWVVNEGIAITENGLEIIGEEGLTENNYRELIMNSQRNVTMRTIRDMASKSEMVVSCTIVSTKKMSLEKTMDSEHNPEWILAEVKVDESLKGSKAGAVVTFAFPGSQDVMWYQSPRFKEGTKTILFLSMENTGSREIKYFTVTSRDQVKDVRDLDMIKQALR